MTQGRPKNFINYFRKALYLVVLTGFTYATAGSYDDFFADIKRDEPRSISALLARGFDANTMGPNGQQGLIEALTEPSLAAAQVLLDWPKTDVNALNRSGESPLMIAAIKGHEAMAKKLIDRGADVNKTGWTPLHYAASAGQLPIIRLL